jgi:hypothetical protein
MEKKMTALDKLLANKETIIANKGINRTATFYHERTGIDFTYRELSDLEREELSESFEGLNEKSNAETKAKIEEAVYKMVARVIIEPNLNDSRLKEEFKYSEPFEFIKDFFNSVETLEVIERIKGLV